jgi:hypothetical protein
MNSLIKQLLEDENFSLFLKGSVSVNPEKKYVCFAPDIDLPPLPGGDPLADVNNYIITGSEGKNCYATAPYMKHLFKTIQIPIGELRSIETPGLTFYSIGGYLEMTGQKQIRVSSTNLSQLIKNYGPKENPEEMARLEETNRIQLLSNQVIVVKK